MEANVTAESARKRQGQKIVSIEEAQSGRLTRPVVAKSLAASSPPTPLLNKFTDDMARAETPGGILNGLDDFASKLLPINVLGVGRMPQRTSDWRSIELGKDVFLHSSAPVEWWNEYAAKAAHGYDPGIMMAKTSLVAYTWTETMRNLEPIGIDRWPYELALKFGIRDALTCCVGQRWLVAYWSRHVLCNVLTQPMRMLLIAAAGFAALRLEQVLGEDPTQPGDRPPITPRELAVLRLVSLGMGTTEIAKLLGIGGETVRSHLKKAQAKLGVRNRAHAAAEAVRQQLIP
jgi:DNA-binding CsgD family transcriptional regulator